MLNDGRGCVTFEANRQNRKMLYGDDCRDRSLLLAEKLRERQVRTLAEKRNPDRFIEGLSPQTRLILIPLRMPWFACDVWQQFQVRPVLALPLLWVQGQLLQTALQS